MDDVLWLEEIAPERGRFAVSAPVLSGALAAITACALMVAVPVSGAIGFPLSGSQDWIIIIGLAAIVGTLTWFVASLIQRTQSRRRNAQFDWRGGDEYHDQHRRGPFRAALEIDDAPAETVAQRQAADYGVEKSDDEDIDDRVADELDADSVDVRAQFARLFGGDESEDLAPTTAAPRADLAMLSNADLLDELQRRLGPGSASVSQRDASQPDTSQPDTSQPDTSQPDTSQPDTSQPDASEAAWQSDRAGPIAETQESEPAPVIMQDIAAELPAGTLDAPPAPIEEETMDLALQAALGTLARMQARANA